MLSVSIQSYVRTYNQVISYTSDTLWYVHESLSCIWLFSLIFNYCEARVAVIFRCILCTFVYVIGSDVFSCRRIYVDSTVHSNNFFPCKSYRKMFQLKFIPSPYLHYCTMFRAVPVELIVILLWFLCTIHFY